MTLDKGKSAPPATVLIVDDNTDTVDILTRLLSRHGMTVLSAYSGRECLDIIIRGRAVDVILLDVMMPEMDGLEVCGELKRLSPALPPVIFLLTAKDDMATRAAGMALGVDEFVVKPVNHTDLLARLETQLSVRRLQREADCAFAAIEPAKLPTAES